MSAMEPATCGHSGAPRKRAPVNGRRGCVWLVRSVVCTLVVLLLMNEAAWPADAKKLKLKDLKKLKKYAVLLAGQRKILYAIPFPVPLPVFVKRQHIYTHVPIIPRYVQQPSHSAPYYYPTAMAYAAGGHDPYGSMSEHATQVADYSPAASSAHSAERNKPGEASSAEPESAGTKSGSRGQQANAGKYLVQLASHLVGQGSLASLLGGSAEQSAGGSQVAKKLLGGSQAKLMSPSAFVATLRGRPGQAPLDSQQQELLAEGSSKQLDGTRLGKYTASELAQMSSLRVPAYQAAAPLAEPMYGPAPPPPALYRMPAARGLHPAYHHPPAGFYGEHAGVMRHPYLEPGAAHHHHHLGPQLDQQQLQEEPAQLEMAASEASQLATLRALVEAKQEHLQNQVSQQVTPQHSVDELRAAESNLLALRAHQLGLASARLRLLNY